MKLEKKEWIAPKVNELVFKSTESGVIHGVLESYGGKTLS